jgi:hypothetical protein
MKGRKCTFFEEGGGILHIVYYINSAQTPETSRKSQPTTRDNLTQIVDFLVPATFRVVFFAVDSRSGLRNVVN